MAITLADFTKIWASTSPLTPYSFSDANYQEGWNFVGATPPARQMWDSIQKQNDEKLKYIVDNFLPLAGGTMTGAIRKQGTVTVVDTLDDSSALFFNAFNTNNAGSQIILYGKDNAGAGRFGIFAKDGTNTSELRGLPNGTLTWAGQPVQTSSDKRLKTDFADIPAEILDKWENVKWQQFRYKADKEAKGDSCRFHTGLVAQDVQDACGDKILKYGILCKEDDMWMVRYTEALCMEVAFLRKKLADMEERIAKLEGKK